MLCPSLETIVALLSNIDGAEVPTISEETNSLFKEYFICSTNSPSKAYCFMMLFTSSIEVVFPTSKFNTTKEPFGTGTRIALEVNFPAKFGNAFATALPAPVSVITMFKAAALPRRYFLCILSTKFWSLV